MKTELAARTAEQVLARRAFERAIVRQDRALEIAATFLVDLAGAMRMSPAEMIDQIAWRVRHMPKLESEED